MRLEDPIIHHFSDLWPSVSGIPQVYHDAVCYVSSAGLYILSMSHILKSYGAVARPWLLLCIKSVHLAQLLVAGIIQLLRLGHHLHYGLGVLAGADIRL